MNKRYTTAEYLTLAYELARLQPGHSVAKSDTIEAMLRQAGPFGDVLVERDRQDTQWGGPDHDDIHFAGDWFDFIDKQTNRFLSAPPDSAKARAALVKIAALAVAGIESIDRKSGLPDTEGQ